MPASRSTNPYQTRRSIEKGSGGALLAVPSSSRARAASSGGLVALTTANALSMSPPGSGASSVGTPAGASR
ncbi:hypothetical protein BE20_03150 [Sorangium cellulosum]|nr:hypothetical protein BE20_03150 [Sorangium cellulosum]